MLLYSGMSLETVRKNSVVFSMTSSKSQYNQALLLTHINYKPRDQVHNSGTESPGHYEVLWTNESGTTFCLAYGFCGIEDTEGELLSTPIPQWLYVFRQCCMAGDLHPNKAHVRLEILLNTLRFCRNLDGLLDEFKQDKFVEWDLTDGPEDKYPRWASLMGPPVNIL